MDGDENEAFRRFLRRVWRDDVAPLLADRRADQRRKAARMTGKLAAATGLLFDGAFGLKGKPFTRFMTVIGASLGAMLPDVWDWEWLRSDAEPEERAAVAERVAARAGELEEAEALALLGLKPGATAAEVKQAWRAVLQRWHPDKAPDEVRRAEYHVRFLAYKAAYERIAKG